MKKAVLEISRMTNHNGPGYRTLVLFKGCPLRCFWCSTPESQNTYPEIGVIRAKCAGEGSCLDVCAVDAIRLTGGHAVIDREKCTYCQACAKRCYRGAIKFFGYQMTIEEIMSEIRKDRSLYMNSGGGVTFSGGEPLMSDMKFITALFRQCKEEDISVGVQTCGAVPWENIKAVLPYMDFFLWDIKHMDDEQHRKLTGCGNKLILENLKKLSTCNVPIHIRFPVIPDSNDNRENIDALCELIKSLEGVVAFDLLPIHHMGKLRYEMLGRAYKADDVPPATEERMRELQKQIEAHGIPCGIGGA